MPLLQRSNFDVFGHCQDDGRCRAVPTSQKPEVLTLLASVGLHGALRLRLPQIQAEKGVLLGMVTFFTEDRLARMDRFTIDGQNFGLRLATLCSMDCFFRIPLVFHAATDFKGLEWKHLDECAPIGMFQEL